MVGATTRTERDINAVRVTRVAVAGAVAPGRGRTAPDALSAHHWCMSDLLATATAAFVELLQTLAHTAQGWVREYPVYTVGIAVGLYLVASSGRRR